MCMERVGLQRSSGQVREPFHCRNKLCQLLLLRRISFFAHFDFPMGDGANVCSRTEGPWQGGL